MKTPIAKENEKYKTKNPITSMMGFFCFGGREWARTIDLLRVKQAL